MQHRIYSLNDINEEYFRFLWISTWWIFLIYDTVLTFNSVQSTFGGVVHKNLLRQTWFLFINCQKFIWIHKTQQTSSRKQILCQNFSIYLRKYLHWWDRRLHLLQNYRVHMFRWNLIKSEEETIVEITKRKYCFWIAGISIWNYLCWVFINTTRLMTWILRSSSFS